MESQTSLICISLVVKGIEHFKSYLLAICICTFENSSFSFRGFVLSMCSLYILDTGLLQDIDLAECSPFLQATSSHSFLIEKKKKKLLYFSKVPLSSVSLIS